MKIMQCLLVAALAAPAVARAQDTTGSDVVVTATRQPTIAARQPYPVTVLTADDLAVGESVADALKTLPQVYVQMPGGRTGFGSVFLRGADPNFTSVLLEGVPLNSPTNSRGGAVNVAALPSAAIDRAEIVSGPVTTLYGSGPLGGAINLLLAPPTARNRATIGGTVSSEGEYSLLGRAQGPLALGWGGSLTAVLDDAGTALDTARFRSRSLDLRLAPLDGDFDKVLVHLAHTRARSFPDSSGGDAFAQFRDFEYRKSDELVVGLDKVLVRSDPVRFGIAGSYFFRRDNTDSPGIATSPFSPGGVPAGSDAIRYRNGIVRPSVAFEAGGMHATVGLEGQWERARSRGFLDFGLPVPSDYAADRDTYSGFAEVGVSSGSVEANSGVRISNIEGLGTKLTGRAGLRYLFTENLSVRASVGNAFKAPSFYALANPFIGNAELRPEQGETVEAGLDWKPLPGSRLELAAFRSRYRDLIDFIPGDVPRLENRAKVTAKGASASFSQQVATGFQFDLGVQYVDTHDAQGGGQLLNRPRWRSSAQLVWQALPELELRARYAFTDKRSDFAVPVGVATLGTMHSLGLSADWQLTPQTSLAINADNLFDDRTADAIGFATLPARVRIGIRHSFQP